MQNKKKHTQIKKKIKTIIINDKKASKHQHSTNSDYGENEQICDESIKEKSIT